MPARAGPGRAEQPGRGDCRPARWRCPAGQHRRWAAGRHRCAACWHRRRTAARNLRGAAGGRPEDGGGPTCGAPGRRPVSRGISGYGVRSLSPRRHRVSAAGLDVNEVEHLLRPHAELDRALLDRGRRLLGRNLLLQLLSCCDASALLRCRLSIRYDAAARVVLITSRQTSPPPSRPSSSRMKGVRGTWPPRPGMQVWRRARGTGPRGRRRGGPARLAGAGAQGAAAGRDGPDGPGPPGAPARRPSLEGRPGFLGGVLTVVFIRLFPFCECWSRGSRRRPYSLGGPQARRSCARVGRHFRRRGRSAPLVSSRNRGRAASQLDRQAGRRRVGRARRERPFDQAVLERVVGEHHDPAADRHARPAPRAGPAAAPRARRSPRSAAPGRCAWPGGRRCAWPEPGSSRGRSRTGAWSR